MIDARVQGQRALVIPIAVARELRALRSGGSAAVQAASVLLGALAILEAREASRAGATRHSRYRLLWWGEIISGTKAEIQAFGIAIDKAFPGEPGARKRAMTVSDPRGLKVLLEFDRYASRENPGQPIYSAMISYPGPEQFPDEPWRDHSPGVRRRAAGHVDEYVGTRANLVAAELVANEEQFPGQPGMRRMFVTILPDGRVLDGPATANKPLARAPGAREIERAGQRAGRITYRVRVRVSEALEEERRRQDDARRHERRRWYESPPRPMALAGPMRPCGEGDA